VPTAARFEDWEFSYAAVLGAAAALRYALGVGLPAIAQRATALAAELRRRLAEIPGVRVLDRGPELCAIVTLMVARSEAASLHGELERRGINSSVAEREDAIYDFDEKGVESCLRLSPHYYNTEQELETVVGAVGEIAGRR
jgi:selenocysteine lyase/cysteine desulfurase